MNKVNKIKNIKKVKIRIKFNWFKSSKKCKNKDEFIIKLDFTKKIRKINRYNNNKTNENSLEKDILENEKDFKIKLPNLDNIANRNSVSKQINNFELLNRDNDDYNKVSHIDTKGILQGKEESEEEEYYDKYFYFSFKELNHFEETIENLFTTGIKFGKKYQADLNNNNNKPKVKDKKLNLKKFKVDPDRIFKNQFFIKNLNEYKKIINQNYNFWLTDSEIYSLYAHFRNFEFFKNTLLSKNEILHNYICYLKNKKLEINEIFN